MWHHNDLVFTGAPPPYSTNPYPSPQQSQQPAVSGVFDQGARFDKNTKPSVPVSNDN